VATSSIFISSVQKELAEERRAVKAFVEGDALLRRYFTVFLFEDLPAADRRADEVYLDEVDRCAIYVGLFGNEYGYEDTPEVTPEVRLVRALVGEMTRQQLQRALELRDDEHFRKAYLQPALDAGLIEMTIPDKPRSSRRKYRLTAEGYRRGRT